MRFQGLTVVTFHLERLEREIGLPVEETEDFAAFFRHIQTHDTLNMKLHADFITGGK